MERFIIQFGTVLLFCGSFALIGAGVVTKDPEITVMGFLTFLGVMFGMKWQETTNPQN